MKLHSLKIERKHWGEHKGRCSGEITFEGQAGKVTVFLTPEKCDQLFVVVSDSIEKTAKECADNLRCNILEHSAQLNDGDDEAAR